MNNTVEMMESMEIYGKYGNISWDDDIPNIWKHKIYVPNHQPGKYMELYGKKSIHMVTKICGNK